MKTRKLTIKRKVVVKSRKRGKLNRKISYRRKQRKSMVRRRKRNSRNNLKKRFSRKMRGGTLSIFGRGKREDSLPSQSGLDESMQKREQIRLQQETKLRDKTLEDATRMINDYNQFKDLPLGTMVYADRHELYADLENAVNEKDKMTQEEIQAKIDAILASPHST